MSSPLARVAAYAVVLVLAVELAVWECFLVPLRLLGVPTPLAAVVAVLGNLTLGRAGARVAGGPAGAFAPGACWLVIALGLSLSGPLGDAVVPGNARGMLFLVAGTVAAVAGVSGGNRRASGATPAGFFRR
jgi:hypothetical protein